MAQQWETNDSARDMTRKDNEGVKELNRITATALAINNAYVSLQPSDFSVDDGLEVTEGDD